MLSSPFSDFLEKVDEVVDEGVDEVVDSDNQNERAENSERKRQQ
jgi:hypothetical protein